MNFDNITRQAQENQLKKQGKTIEEQEAKYQMMELEADLEDALAERNWVKIKKIEDEIARLNEIQDTQDNDKTRIMSESQKLRYEWIRDADRERLVYVQMMLEIIDCIKHVYATLPDDSEDFELIKQALLQQAQNEGATMDQLRSFQAYIDAIYKEEMKKRR